MGTILKHCYVFMSHNFRSVYCNWVQRKIPSYWRWWWICKMLMRAKLNFYHRRQSIVVLQQWQLHMLHQFWPQK